MFGRHAEKKIPGFLIKRRIAEGGMATVYLAEQESLARPVALKILKQPGNPAFSKRFLSEGRTLASLRHQNVVTIHDIGIVKDQHYISMEYVEGGDLASAIERGFKPNEALRIVRQLAGCLSFVHKQGVVHRDIKPANILFREDGIPLLSDFGIAKQLNSDLKLTLEGTALGSPHYLSPEQGQGQKVDGRSDIYSLGIVLYEMLTGQPPFKGKTPIEAVMLHVQKPLPPLKRSLTAFMPLLERMTAKKPSDRFRNCAELEKAIGELLNDDTAATPTRTGRRRRPAAKQAAAEKPTAKQTRPSEITDISLTMTMATDSLVKQKPQKSRRAYVWLAMILFALTPASAVYWQTWFPATDMENAVSMTFDWGRANFHTTDQPAKPATASPAQPAAPPQARVLPKTTNRTSNRTQLPEGNPHKVASIKKTDGVKQNKTPVTSKPDNKPVTVAKAPAKNTKSTSPSSRKFQIGNKHTANKKISKTHTNVKKASKAEPIRQSSSSTANKQKRHYMALAKQRFSDSKLTRPKRDNATYYYRKVLKLDPNYQDAKKGLDAIAERYADLTLKASKRNDFDQAQTYLLRGLRINPSNPRLVAMKSIFKTFNNPVK